MKNLQLVAALIMFIIGLLCGCNGKTEISSEQAGSPSKRAYKLSATSDGLIAYYPFNGNANDESGNGHNGTVYGATLTTDRFGNANSAYSFNGTSGYIRIDSSAFDPATSSTSGFTVTAWAKANDLYYGGENRGRPIVSKRKYNGYIYSPQLLLMLDGRSSQNVARFFLGIDDTPAGYDTVSSNNGSIQTDQWYFVVGVYNPATHTESIYINGQLVSSASHTTFPTASTYDIFIGKTEYGDFFNGAIDDVRIYSRALSSSEIQSLYGNSDTSLIAYYPFNGNANDESGNGHNGTVYGATLTTDRFGNANSAYSFNGTSGYIRIDSSAFDPATSSTSGFTVTAWAKANDLYYGGENRGRPIVSKRKYNGYIYSPQLLLMLDGRSSQNVARFFLGIDDTPAGYDTVSSNNGSIQTDQWYFVVGVYNPATHTESIYINGQLVSSASHTTFPTASTYDIFIGKTEYGDFFNGAIDDVRIYSRALSSSEIQSLY